MWLFTVTSEMKSSAASTQSVSGDATESLKPGQRPLPALFARSSLPNAMARSRNFGVHLISKVTWAVGRVENIELGCEQPNLSAERIALVGVKRGQQVGLRRPKEVIEAGQELVALLGGKDLSGAPVGWIRASLDQVGGLEVIEEGGHDGSVDSEVLGEGELAANAALSGG